MRPSGRVLDHNLGELLRRAYRPARTRPEFVARLERALEPWIGEESPDRAAPPIVRSTRLRRLGFAALAVAAALLLLLVIRPDGEGGGERPAASLASLLAAREVAVRRAEDAPWRAAGRAELTLDAPYLELATPERVEATVRGEAGWSARLRETGQLRVEERDGGVRFTVISGSSRFETVRGGYEVDAPRELWWREGELRDGDGALFAPLTGGNEVEVREPVEVVVTGTGDGATEREPDPPPPTPATATLIGGVRGSADEAPPGVLEVTLLRAVALPQISDPMTRTFEGTEGTFRWEGLEPGHYSVYVHAAGWAMLQRRGLELLAGSTTELELELERGGAITGYVVDRESGAAISGALVVSERDLPLQVISTTVADFPDAARAFSFTRADGFFELKTLSAGSHRLRAGGADHAPSWREAVEVSSGETTDGVILELGPGGGIVGRVEHPDGSPRAGTVVVMNHFTSIGEVDSMTYVAAITDGEGRYGAEHLAPGLYVVLEFGDDVVEASEYEPRYVPTRIDEGRVTRVDFLGQGVNATLSGVVRDASGASIARANVYLCDEGEMWSGWTGDTSTVDGAFAIEGVEAGEYTLYAGRGESFVRVTDLSLSAGEEKEVEVVLEGRSVEVRVIDAVSEAPLTDAVLMLFESRPSGSAMPPKGLVARTWLGNGGNYRLADLPEGTFDLLVATDSGTHAATWHRDLRVAGEGGDERPVVALELAGSIRIRVEDAAGDPIAGVRVALSHPLGVDRDHPPIPSSERTDAAGEAEIGHLVPGRWTATISGAGHRPRTLTVEVTVSLVSERVVVLSGE